MQLGEAPAQPVLVAGAGQVRERRVHGGEGGAGQQPPTVGELRADPELADGGGRGDEADDELVALPVDELGEDGDLEPGGEAEQAAQLVAVHEARRRDRGDEDDAAGEQRHALADARGDGDPGQPVHVGERGDPGQEGERAGGGADRERAEALEPLGDVAGAGGQQRERERAAEDAEHLFGVGLESRREVEQVDEQRGDEEEDESEHDAEQRVGDERGERDAPELLGVVAPACEGGEALDGRAEPGLEDRSVEDQCQAEGPDAVAGGADGVEDQRNATSE